MEDKSIKLVFSESDQSADTIQCHLSPEISADDVEIRWFKETECVCFYKNGRFIEGIGYEGRVSLCNEELKRGNMSLLLKESDVGDYRYLCQVISGNRREEITVRKSSKSTTETLLTEQPGKGWTDKERMEMVNSALSAVFQSLENREKTEREKEDPEGNVVSQTNRVIEEKPNRFEVKAIQQEETILMSDYDIISPMDISGGEPEEQPITHLDNQQSVLFSEKIKVFSISDGKTNECKKQFIYTLRTQIENLMEVSEEESDIILNFCPIVSRAGTDIDAALKKFKNSTESKLNVLVVLHHTFDPEKTVLDSSRSVNREDILTVDLLFYEDTGLLACQKNSDAYDKVVNWLVQQGREKGIPIFPFQKTDTLFGFSRPSWLTLGNKPEPPKQNMQQMKSTSSHSVKYFLSVTGDAQKHHMHFINALKKQMSLMEVFKEKDSDVIFLFCPEITEYHSSKEKPVILISLHDIMDPGSVSNISTFEKRHNFIPVNFIFLEDEGLLDCKINRKEISEVLKGLQQKRDL